MSTATLIPLIASPQSFSAQLTGSKGVANTYNFTVVYRDADGGGWFMDIADVDQNSLLSGVPLVPNVNLLGQYAYLGVGGSLVLLSAGGADDAAMPLYSELGITAQLYFVVKS